MNATPRHRVGWQRRVRAALTERLALKASAVLLATVLWFVVGARAPPRDVAGVGFAPREDSPLRLGSGL
jgi:hypothetical protein